MHNYTEKKDNMIKIIYLLMNFEKGSVIVNDSQHCLLRQSTVFKGSFKYDKLF